MAIDTRTAQVTRARISSELLNRILPFRSLLNANDQSFLVTMEQRRDRDGDNALVTVSQLSWLRSLEKRVTAQT